MLGVDKLVLETRQPDKDAKDVELYLAMKRSGALKRIDIEHRGAVGEPRLWLPDLVVGMYGDDICGNLGRSRWRDSWETVKAKVTVLKIRP